jgi:hypothetical protein
MADKKYGKLIVNAPITERVFGKGLTLNANKYFPELKYWLRWNLITEPWLMEPEPHSHDFDQVWHIFGADSMDISDFRAEIEISLGEEGEKHVITSPKVVYIPKGLIHCPVNFKKIEKPIIWLNIAFTDEYLQTLGSGLKRGLEDGWRDA